MGKATYHSEELIETVFHVEGSATGEVEAWVVKNLLEASGIPALVVGDSVLPNLPFEVKVAPRHADEARRLIARAEKPRT
jgi:hypothetical protein